MKLEWKQASMSQGRVDLDLMRNGRLVGFFRDYQNTKWEVAFCRGMNKPDMRLDHLTLEEAKAVVEAMVRMEGVPWH